MQPEACVREMDEGVSLWLEKKDGWIIMIITHQVIIGFDLVAALLTKHGIAYTTAMTTLYQMFNSQKTLKTQEIIIWLSQVSSVSGSEKIYCSITYCDHTISWDKYHIAWKF